MKNLLDTLTKTQLRAKCRELEIKNYGLMNNTSMREAIAEKLRVKAKEEKEVEESVEERRARIQKAVQEASSQIEKKTLVIDGKKAKKLEKVEENKGRRGYKIEKVRKEQNGVRMPSIGTICHNLWEIYFSMDHPTIKKVKEVADTYGYDRTTATIQFYQWRKFNGISGRSE